MACTRMAHFIRGLLSYRSTFPLDDTQIVNGSIPDEAAHALRLGLLESDGSDANLLGKPARLLNHANGD